MTIALVLALLAFALNVADALLTDAILATAGNTGTIQVTASTSARHCMAAIALRIDPPPSGAMHCVARVID